MGAPWGMGLREEVSWAVAGVHDPLGLNAEVTVNGRRIVV